jgi:hypothetical protein
MLTTIGDCVFATFLKVWASRVPVTGALFTGGSASVCADEGGDKSSREAMTIPTMADETAMSRA